MKHLSSSTWSFVICIFQKRWKEKDNCFVRQKEPYATTSVLKQIFWDFKISDFSFLKFINKLWNELLLKTWRRYRWWDDERCLPVASQVSNAGWYVKLIICFPLNPWTRWSMSKDVSPDFIVNEDENRKGSSSEPPRPLQWIHS